MLFDLGGEGTEFKVCENPPDRRPSMTNSVLYVKKEGVYINFIILFHIYVFIFTSEELKIHQYKLLCK